MQRGDSSRVKRRLNISSLNAAICNVALFKSMKEREFRDEIHISYSEQGVLLEASSVQEWQRASRFVEGFLSSKRIAVLGWGFEKEVYEQLIIRGLKEYTRRMKEAGEECPYINIIHYQKLRKSCEYMDKERYVEPLKDWERKNRRSPNFAFLIVEPPHKYEDVKRRLLEYLLKRDLPLADAHLSLLYFLLTAFASPLKDDFRDAFDKTYLELALERTRDKGWRNENGEFEDYRVRVVNYTALRLHDLDYRIVPSARNLERLGLEFISARELEGHCRKVRQFLPGSVAGGSVSTAAVFEAMQSELVRKHGEDFCVVPFKRSEREKYNSLIDKLVTQSQARSMAEVAEAIEKNVLCEFEEMELLGEVGGERAGQRGYRIFRACLGDCPYMVHAYAHLPLSEIDSFLLYLDQLRAYSCTYLVRFYGMAVQYGRAEGVAPAELSAEEKLAGYSYYLIFDYHHRTLAQMAENDMILDNFQVAQMVLQLLYLLNFLHTHDEPRSLGHLTTQEVYWPLRVVLPFLRSDLRDSRKEGEGRAAGFEGDVRLAGLVMKALLESGGEEEAEQADDHFSTVLQAMLKESKYDRITLAKCIASFEELLMLN